MDGADADPVALARLLELAVAALHETRPEQLWSLAFTELLDALDADLAVRKAEEWSPGEGTVRLWTPEGPAHHLLGPEQLDVIRTGYPFVDHYAAGHPLEPLTARATAGAHAWRHAAPAGQLRDALGSTDILGLPLPRPEKGAIHGCLLHRTGRRPFTPAHLAYARRAQPVIAAVEAHAAHLRAWRTTPAARRRRRYGRNAPPHSASPRARSPSSPCSPRPVPRAPSHSASASHPAPSTATSPTSTASSGRETGSRRCCGRGRRACCELAAGAGRGGACGGGARGAVGRGAFARGWPGRERFAREGFAREGLGGERLAPVSPVQAPVSPGQAPGARAGRELRSWSFSWLPVPGVAV